eukprot:TRINITY_DN1411_c0_g1_i4.p1 TRINITY_DN1411_c0_g1~~TRINITY_DN1411_c0_g1_i4.p1  ORF type:complete len:530 (-),score=92.46 TRINITY_DN1411_c0_g1_i4:96-1685(-)
MRRMTSLFFVVVAVVATATCVSASPGLTLWPEPQNVNVGLTTVSISPKTFQVTPYPSASSVLNQAIAQYVNHLMFLFQEQTFPAPSAPAITSLAMNIKNTDDTNLQFGVDESYSITVPSGGQATLTANTVWGAIRGLETFSQLVYWNYTIGAYQIFNTPINITDAPRFPWRGLMMDTARHYFPVDFILHTIDAMSYSKYNVLHWHAVDAQSFPVMSKSYPQLAQKADLSGQGVAVYLPSDLENVVSYARTKGIRVVIEFDIPGHAYSWGKAFPNITAYCEYYAANINNIPLDPTAPFTYEVLTNFLTEMAGYFPDNYMHTGGDELLLDCWNRVTSITNWMKQNNIPNLVALEQYFEDNLDKILSTNKKTKMVWEEVFKNGVKIPPNTIVEVWSNASLAQLIVDAGLPTIIAHPWYLDKQIPDPPSTHYEWVDTWKDFYAFEPTTAISNNFNLYLGGEAAMWAEQVDQVNFDSRVWPRACAPAERLWSAQGVTDVNYATTRLVAHRCRMAQRGVGAGPIATDYCPLPQKS